MYSRSRGLALFLCCLLFVGLFSGVFAQEDSEAETTPEVQVEPTIEPTATPLPPTAVPTEQPTSTPVVEPSHTPVVPTETPVAETTAEVTPEVTDEVTVPTETPIATATATVEPTATDYPSEPELALALSSTFDGPENYWTLDPGWVLTTADDGSGVVSIGAVQTNALAAYIPVMNAAVEARFRLDGGTFVVGVQKSSVASYEARVTADGDVTLYRGALAFGSAKIEPFALDEWHTVRLSAMNGVLRVAVDGATLITTHDDVTLPPGAVYFGSAGDNPLAQILVDSIEIRVPVGELFLLPTPQPTAAPTEIEVTEEATPEVTEEPVVTSPEKLALLASQENAGALTDLWAVILEPGVNPQAFAATLGFEYVGPVGELPNTYLLRKPETDLSLAAAQSASSTLSDSSAVVWYEQQYGVEPAKRISVNAAQDEEETPELEGGSEPAAIFEAEDILEPDINAQAEVIRETGTGPGSAGAITNPTIATIYRNGNGTLGQSLLIALNGDVVAAGVGTRNRGSGEINLKGIPSDATVRQAFLYWANIGYTNGYSTALLNNTAVPGTLIGTGGTTCWGTEENEENYVYRADVTSLISGNGKYVVGGLPNFAPPGGYLWGSPFTDSQGATLVVIYESPKLPYKQIVINDGAVTAPGFNTVITNTFSNFIASDPLKNAKLIMLVGDGQSFQDGVSTFNGKNLGKNIWKGALGNYWDTRTYNVTSFKPIVAPSTVTIDSGNDCLLWAANILSVTSPWHPNEPTFPSQWHLANTGQFGSKKGLDTQVAQAWGLGYDGDGVQIAIVDDGLQYTHPDIATNYASSGSYDFVSNDTDPLPTIGNGHGTSAGGVAAAGVNGVCGVGAAFNADLAGIRLLSGLTTDANEASALNYLPNTNDIYSNSWGPIDSGNWLGFDSPGTPGLDPGWNRPLALAALLNGVTNGRGGLGNVYVWAGGNGREYFDNVNADNYANSRYVIAVAALTNKGKYSWYSEPGAPLLVTALSNGGTSGIYTTDLLGGDGYSASDCTGDFGGTSSATPLVSGVVAMILEANPNLGWRDVQHILVNTAVKVDNGNSDWKKNKAGYNINHNYGFGHVNASAAVDLARHWVNVPAEQSYSSPVTVVNTAIPDNTKKGITTTLNLNVPDPNFVIEHVEVVFNATHTWRGDIEVILTAPSGTSSTLMAPRFYDNSVNGYVNWRFMTVRNWGESASGNWKIQVNDRFQGDTGIFQNWQVVVYGYSGTPKVTAKPQLVQPGNKVTSINPLLTYEWTAVANATAYDIQFDTEAGFKNPPFYFTENGTSTALSLPNGKWYWRVRPRSGNQLGKWSAARTITIDTAGPPAPLVTAPKYESITTNPRPTIKWKSVPGASNYVVQVDTDSGFGSPDVDAMTNKTSYKVPTDLAPGTYYIRVMSIDKFGNTGSFGSPMWYFEIQ